MLQYWAVAPPATSPWYCWLKERSAIPADSAGNHCQLIPLSCCFSAALPPFTDTRQVPAWSNTGQDACEKDKPSKCHEIAVQPFSGQARTLMMWTCPLVTAPVTEQFYSLFNPPGHSSIVVFNTRNFFPFTAAVLPKNKCTITPSVAAGTERLAGLQRNAATRLSPASPTSSLLHAAGQFSGSALVHVHL